MPLFTKPQFNSVWASIGAKLTPDVAKISQGWVVEIPPHEYENWSQNRQDALLAHINQVGIPMWDQTVEYQAGKSYTQGTTTGVVYRAVTTNTNVNPELDIQGNWTVAFEATGQALLKANNLSDVPDKALARENLGIASTSFYDGRYLVKSENLADVPNKASARNNLGLGNSATLSVGSVGGTVAAGDDSRIVNATPQFRSVTAGAGLVGGGNLTADRSLGLGTPSTITATSTNYVAGTTHGHAMDVGSFMPTGVADMTYARALGVTYVNNTRKVLFVTVSTTTEQSQQDLIGVVNGITVAYQGIRATRVGNCITFVVPIGASYSASIVVGSGSLLKWVETT